MAKAVEEKAGHRTHLGKLHAWSAGGGAAPEEITGRRSDGTPVWTAELPEAENGLICPGTPVGLPAFVHAEVDRRVAKEKQLLAAICLLVEDSQRAWTLLLRFAVPRANHTVRTLPPSLSVHNAAQHDDALWSAFCTLFG